MPYHNLYRSKSIFRVAVWCFPPKIGWDPKEQEKAFAPYGQHHPLWLLVTTAKKFWKEKKITAAKGEWTGLTWPIIPNLTQPDLESDIVCPKIPKSNTYKPQIQPNRPQIRHKPKSSTNRTPMGHKSNHEQQKFQRIQGEKTPCSRTRWRWTTWSALFAQIRSAAEMNGIEMSSRSRWSPWRRTGEHEQQSSKRAQLDSQADPITANRHNIGQLIAISCVRCRSDSSQHRLTHKQILRHLKSL